MISKELLSEVLEREVTDFEYWDNNEYRCTAYFDGFRQRFFLNIYELAHKCKEWIINKGYVLKLCYVLENDTRELCFIETTLLRSNQYSSDYYDIDSKTEVEAVIKACEWILNSKDSK